MTRDDAVQAIAEALVTIPGTTVQYPRSVALTILDALAPFLVAERERLAAAVEAHAARWADEARHSSSDLDVGYAAGLTDAARIIRERP